MLQGDQLETLLSVLEVSKQLGFLGKAPVENHITHAQAHSRAAFGGNEPEAGLTCLDLGTGGGVPGLVIALDHPQLEVTLVERADRRCEHLTEAVAKLGVAESVAVICADAADIAQQPAHREHYDVILSRSFGRPALTAECAAGLLIAGGDLVVSEPPVQDPGRWSAPALRKLGLESITLTQDEPHFRTIRKVDLCPPEFPRPWSQLVKQPLF